MSLTVQDSGVYTLDALNLFHTELTLSVQGKDFMLCSSQHSIDLFFLLSKKNVNLKKAGQKSSAACIIKTLVSAVYDINEVKHNELPGCTRPNQDSLSFKPHPSALFCSVTVAGN